jgi:hypothetical protein
VIRRVPSWQFGNNPPNHNRYGYNHRSLSTKLLAVRPFYDGHYPHLWIVTP